MHASLQNDLDAKSGTVLFGGIDSQKYIGNLATMPILSDVEGKPDNVTSYMVHLQGLDVDGAKLNSLDANAVLDSGSTISLIPDSQAQDIFRQFGVRTIKEFPAPLVDCAFRGDRGKGTKFSFKFDGKTIRVPMDEMVINAIPAELQTPLKRSKYASQFSGWDKICVFGIGSTYDYGVRSNKFVLLGDTFLRSAYVAYDMANLQIGIAQANINTDKSNVVEVKKDAKELPSVAGVEGKSPSRCAPSKVADVPPREKLRRQPRFPSGLHRCRHIASGNCRHCFHSVECFLIWIRLNDCIEHGGLHLMKRRIIVEIHAPLSGLRSCLERERDGHKLPHLIHVQTKAHWRTHSMRI